MTSQEIYDTLQVLIDFIEGDRVTEVDDEMIEHASKLQDLMIQEWGPPNNEPLES